MPETACPKCKQIKTDSRQCPKCGINFNEYEEQKHLRLVEVSRLLGEGKFVEAKQIADRLPFDFPDNRNDFLLLLSNINRDISIIEKCRLARKCFDDGDYVQATFLLRNIKAFDQKLDEQVIVLRRKIERESLGGETFSRAVEAFDRGDFGTAKKLFEKVDQDRYREQVTGYQGKIEGIKANFLTDAVHSIKDSELTAARAKLESLRALFPELGSIIDGYVEVVAKREEIQGNILHAADKALEEGRYLEAKILYLFLTIRFPDTRQAARFHIREIGERAVVTFADLNDHGIIDLGKLGLDADGDGTVAVQAVPEKINHDFSPGPVADFYADGAVLNAKAKAGKEGIVDTVKKPSDFGGIEVADFIF